MNIQLCEPKNNAKDDNDNNNPPATLDNGTVYITNNLKEEKQKGLSFNNFSAEENCKFLSNNSLRSYCDSRSAKKNNLLQEEFTHNSMIDFDINNIQINYNNSNNFISANHNKSLLLQTSIEQGLSELDKIYGFKINTIKISFLRNLKLHVLNKYALRITKAIKIFIHKIKQRKNNKNSMQHINYDIKNTCNYEANKAFTGLALQAYANNAEEKFNKSSENLTNDDSGYSETVIDLVRIIQLYVYDINNSAINKYNYLLRMFNRWKSISLKQINCDAKKLAFSHFIDTNKSIAIEDNTNSTSITSMPSMQNKELIKSSSLVIYCNYISRLTNNIELFINKIQKIAIKNLFGFYFSKTKRNENVKNYSNIRNLEVYSFDINLTNSINNNYNYNKVNINYGSNQLLNRSLAGLPELNSIIPSNFKSNTSMNNILVNKSFNLENNYFSAKNINKSVFFKCNNSSNNFNNNNNHNLNNSTNDPNSNLNNRSLVSGNTNINNKYNNSLNQSIYSKNVRLNSDMESEEEFEELNEIKISCAIEIQNCWRDYQIQKYILKYAKKLQILDKLLKKNKNKLKHFVEFYISHWQKNILLARLIRSVINIQKAFKRFHLRRSKSSNKEIN